ncbi:cytidylyltransferase domain-containing protein [Candidatus Pelagibacter bacterium nBUS_28]|jgi:spore coat polysaccharide biosynthesis protein SpsF (cytidylyltransferase family)|uniref:cytidylyltransferase domain-containing protein n=1 Tax=Candidatus Pelagibacter bacterium nBUS_28 TaxID=3374189 RepID=UPI003EC08ECF|tara:strand:+ start:86 stop:802 length:717 start_codon:yes stop_codon:yes gene_type:complete
MKNKHKIAVFLAARSGSKRLPNKHFLKLNSNLTIIDLCIFRLKKIKLVNKIFLCTTRKNEDDKFKSICNFHDIKLFRGSTSNVAKRIINCAKENSIETIVRITADCPLIDPNLVDNCIKLHFNKKNDYTSNVLKLSFPDGLDVEVFSLNALINSQHRFKSILNKEHVTYNLRKSILFKKSNYENHINYSNRRWTLDNLDDYKFLKKVVKYFSPKIYFSWKDLIKAEKYNKSLVNIKKR